MIQVYKLINRGILKVLIKLNFSVKRGCRGCYAEPVVRLFNAFNFMEDFVMKHVSQGESQRATPNHNWTLEQLTKYVTDCFKCRTEMNDDLAALGRKSAVELFRAGRALSIAKDQLKSRGGYEHWCKENHIAKTTAFEAITLFANAKTEAAVEKMTITEAKTHFKVVKKKSSKLVAESQKSHQKPKQVDDPPPAKEPDSVSSALAAIAQKLLIVSGWNRGKDDPQNISELADRCIGLLVSIKLTPASVSKKRKEGKNDAA